MSRDRVSTLDILKGCPHVRRQVGMAYGSLLLAFGVHNWLVSALVEGGPAKSGATDAAFLAGALSSLALLTAFAVVGWVCGGLAIESADDAVSAKRNLRVFWRNLAVLGLVMTIGAALDAWPLIGGLILVAGGAVGAIANSYSHSGDKW